MTEREQEGGNGNDESEGDPGTIGTEWEEKGQDSSNTETRSDSDDGE